MEEVAEGARRQAVEVDSRSTDGGRVGSVKTGEVRTEEQVGARASSLRPAVP